MISAGKCLCGLLLLSILLVACDGESSRSAHDRKVDIEAAASGIDPAALPPLSASTAEPLPTQAGVGAAVADLPCRPDISAEECAQARSSLARDLHAMRAEHLTQCAGARTHAADTRRQLQAQSTNLEADLDELANEIVAAENWIAANCSD
ncbi:MAG: hypothetical protein R3E75_07650 [Steroidobacteraceae bacterium]